MDVHSHRIASVFSTGGDVTYRLPYFQREYAWEKENWKTLLDDILSLYDLYTDEKPPEHFLGSLVVVSEGMAKGLMPVFKLVDGQQRLVTVSLLLCALAEAVKVNNPNLYNTIRRYITNHLGSNDLLFKVVPTTKYNDRQIYQSIMNGNAESDPQNSSRILSAYLYYKNEIGQKLTYDGFDIERLFKVIVNCLQVVFINLTTEEKPYQIFESLNAKGKSLTQADLVRNYIAMKLPESRQQEMFENHWLKIEEILQEARTVGRSRLGELTAFIRHYLAFCNGVLGNEEHIYARFRDRIEQGFNMPGDFEQEIIRMQRFAGYYNRFLRPEQECDTAVREYLIQLNIMEFSTGYPFLLALFDAQDSNKITKDQLIEGLQVLENYIIRRYLTNEPTNYLNKVFPTLWNEINLEIFIPSLKLVLVQHNYPANYAVKQKAILRRLYDNSASTRAKTTFILERINRHLSMRDARGGYTVLDGPSTIEHIMPQSLDDIWQSDLGESFSQIYDQYLHTLGNLTLVTSEWNSELSNLPFSQKQEKLKNHALLINHDYFNQNILKWDDFAIKSRAEKLIENILEIWPALGTPPAPTYNPGTKPISLLFCKQSLPVTTWRDVAEQTTEGIIQLTDNFESLAVSLPSYLSQEKFPIADRQLSNGWYLNTNLSSAAIKLFCRQLIIKAGLSESDWQVKEVK